MTISQYIHNTIIVLILIPDHSILRQISFKHNYQFPKIIKPLRIISIVFSDINLCSSSNFQYSYSKLIMVLTEIPKSQHNQKLSYLVCKYGFELYYSHIRAMDDGAGDNQPVAGIQPAQPLKRSTKAS